MPNGDIDLLAREVDVMKRGADPKVNRRVDLGKAAEAMDEPLRGKVG